MTQHYKKAGNYNFVLLMGCDITVNDLVSKTNPNCTTLQNVKMHAAAAGYTELVIMASPCH